MMNNLKVVSGDMSVTGQSQDSSTEDTSPDSERENTSLSVSAERKPIKQTPDIGDTTSGSESSTSSQSVSGGTRKTLLSRLPKLDSKDWYKQTCFDRYWDHYRYVTAWYRKHCNVYRTLQRNMRKFTSHLTETQTAYHPYSHPHPHTFVPYSSQLYSDPHAVKPRSKKAKKRQASSRSKLPNETSLSEKRKQLDVGMDVDMDGGAVPVQEDGMSCDTTDMSEAPDLVPVEEHMDSLQMDLDISEEMLDFFAKTQKHRKEREAVKKAEKQKEKEEKRINIEEVTGPQRERTSDAPKERPGSRRTAEMKLLYGKGAALIHGMETAQQMTYDRNLDASQPKYWPNMPFRIIFSST